VFRRCGHLPQEEYPREFASLIADFCKGATVDADAADREAPESVLAAESA
jgi:hypothetical protein